MDLGAVRDMDFEPFVKAHLSSPQRLLLVNTSERKKREAGALERENGSAGNGGSVVYNATSK